MHVTIIKRGRDAMHSETLCLYSSLETEHYISFIGNDSYDHILFSWVCFAQTAVNERVYIFRNFN
jgi:hypothetical protein